MKDFESIFTPEEKAALSVLVNRGFQAFAEAKLEDVRDLDGRRHRTFRNQGRYDLILALKTAEKPPAMELAPDPDPEPVRPPEDMSYAELRAEAKTIPDVINVSGKKKAELLEMIVEYRRRKELLARKF